MRNDERFARSLSGRFGEYDRLPPELRGAVAVAFAITEGEAAFEPLVGRLRAAARDQERLDMVSALASLRVRSLARKVLALVPSPGVTPSRALNLLGEMSGNPAARAELFAWQKDHAEHLTKLWAGTPLKSLFLRNALAGLGIDDPDEVERYFESHAPPDAVQAVRQGLESLRLAVRLRRAVRGNVPVVSG